MNSKAAIDSAIAIHSLWKRHLLDAIENGTSEFNVEGVKKDTECQFGRWLNSISNEERNTKEFIEVCSLHIEFHKVAAEILELAITGYKKEALNILSHGGNYGKISEKLIAALNDWKSKL